VGHHFGALLACPQRAWLDYWGNPKQKLRPPSFLLQYQREGLQHESEMCEKLYPGAVRISENADPETRKAKTLDAIRSGAAAILQGYLRDGDDLGVIDVLEREDGGTLVYRVGEFKRSASLQTEHVLQVRWYTELLQRTVGSSTSRGFFVLGDGKRKEVDLAEVESLYASCKKRLAELRRLEAEPGPHLCRNCVTCPWRGICIPRLVESKHVSLLPGINRGHARRLADLGVTEWPAVVDTTDEQLADVGLVGSEAKRLRVAVENLKKGKPVTRFDLKPSILAGVTSISLGYPEQPNEREHHIAVPSTIWYETPSGTGSIAVAGKEIAQLRAELKSLLCRGTLALYGERDIIALTRLCLSADTDSPACLDIVKLIEAFVHAPIMGLELQQLMDHLGRPSASAAEDRVYSIRAAIEWLGPVPVSTVAS